MNKTKRRIFNTAIKMFSEKGYDNTSVEEITAIAGVAKGSLYYHFSKKEDIFDMLLKEGFELLKNNIEIKTKNCTTALEKIKAVILIQIKVIVKYEYFLNVVFSQLWGEEEKNKNDSETTLEDENIYDINAYNDEFDDSIRNYKGFYIARYEAGKERSNGKSILVSKPNVLPWTQIVWEEARKQSLKMYKENDLFQTDLVNSYAWDTICNWIRDCGYNIDDSTEYGNYQNSANGTKKVMETASNDRWKTNNIYDMAGNAWEYTTEECGEHDKKHIGRGGDYLNDGDKYPISTRGTSSDESNLDVGFRVVLYLK